MPGGFDDSKNLWRLRDRLPTHCSGGIGCRLRLGRTVSFEKVPIFTFDCLKGKG